MPPSRAAARSRTSSWPPTPTARSPPCGCTSSPTWAPTCSSSRRASRCSGRSCTTASTTCPAYSFSCTAVFTTMTPTDAYRGAGRPEATYAIERAMDALARQMGVDPVEIRRRNFIPTEQFPYNAPAGWSSTAATTPRTSPRPLELVRWDERKAEQAARRAAGGTVELGLGISTYVEMCGLAPSRVLASLNYGAGGWEAATVRVLPTGKVQVVTGTSPARAGPRDVVVDDRGRQARHRPRRRRGAPLRHRHLPARAGHLRLALAGRRRHRHRAWRATR